MEETLPFIGGNVRCFRCFDCCSVCGWCMVTHYATQSAWSASKRHDDERWWTLSVSDQDPEDLEPILLKPLSRSVPSPECSPLSHDSCPQYCLYWLGDLLWGVDHPRLYTSNVFCHHLMAVEGFPHLGSPWGISLPLWTLLPISYSGTWWSNIPQS